jgi:hypothetical protein
MDSYEVKIDFSVTRVSEDGKKSDFFDSEVKYTNLPYEGVVALETLMLEVLNKSNSWGVDRAVAHGLKDKLAALGVVVK